MRVLAKSGFLLLAMLIAGTPLMACMLPLSVLTPEEQACCQEMANQCGQDQMPPSHPCCKTVGPTDHNALAKASFKLLGEFHALYLLQPLTQAAELAQLATANFAAFDHAPPGLTASSTTDILRI